jgi:hypothetical protein
VVTNERRQNSTVRIGEAYLDLFFVPEREVLKPSNPEHSVSLAHARTVRDTSLILSTSLASNTAVLATSARRSSSQRLTSALKSLGRAEEALSQGRVVDADYWLLTAAYDCAYSWLHSREVPPSPSHLLNQLKNQSKGATKGFESFTSGVGLEKASRTSCVLRLDGVAVLYDVLGGGYEGKKTAIPAWSATKLGCLRSKALELNERVEHAECYSYLGIEMLNALRQLTTREGGAARSGIGPSTLTAGRNSFLGERILKDLGLGRERDSLKQAMELLRVQVSRLARRT